MTRRVLDPCGVPVIDGITEALASTVPTRARRVLNSRPVALLADGIVWVLQLQRIARRSAR